MKTDVEYIKALLDFAENHPKPFFDVHDLAAAGVDITSGEFVHHLLQLEDRKLIAAHEGSIGVEVLAGGGIQVVVKPLRITAGGSDFQKAMEDPSTAERVKGAVSSFGLGVGVKVASSMLGALAQSTLTMALSG
jgi:hypothetical protein